MKFILRYFWFVFINSSLILLNGQTHILVKNNGLKKDKPHVSIKWFSKNLVQEKPVYLFRKEVDSKTWVLLRQEAFKAKPSIEAQAKSLDKDLNTFEEIINGRKRKPIVDFLMLSIWVKSIESNPFAEFLGITYTDTTAEMGKTYQYALKASNNPYDPNLIISVEYTISKTEQIIAPVENVQLSPIKKAVGINWKQDNLRFWAVNIYRRKSDEQKFTLKGGKPTMVNLYESKEEKNKRSFLVTDDELKEGGLYFYKIGGVDFFGKEGVLTAEIPVFIKDKTMPEPPLLRKDTILKQGVHLDWLKPKDLDLKGYYVYRSSKPNVGFEKINKNILPSLTTKYIDTPESTGDYYYFVTSVDTADNESPSNHIIANIEDITPPAMPTDLKSRVDTGVVIINWKQNQEADLWGYNIYRGLVGQDKSQFVLLNKKPLKVNVLNDTINKVAVNKFVYAIAAIDTNYNLSKYSDTVSAQMPDIVPPAKVYIKSVIFKDGKLGVSWLQGKEKDLSGFDIYCENKLDHKGKIKLNTSKISAMLRQFSIALPFSDATDFNIYMTASDISGNVSEFSEPYTFHVANANPQNSSLGSINLKAKSSKKEKLIKLTWKYELKSNQNVVPNYLVYEKTPKGEYKPISTYISHTKFQVVPHVGRNIYQVRLYLPSGNMVKSEDVSVEIKDSKNKK